MTTDMAYRDIIDPATSRHSQPWTELHDALARETPDPPPLVLEAYQVAHIVGLLREAQEAADYVSTQVTEKCSVTDMQNLRDCLRYALEWLDPEVALTLSHDTTEEESMATTTRSETIERLAQMLVDARVVDCAYGDCGSYEDMVPHGTEVGYDTITGHEGPGNWTRVTLTPTDAQWQQACDRARLLW